MLGMTIGIYIIYVYVWMYLFDMLNSVCMANTYVQLKNVYFQIA